MPKAAATKPGPKPRKKVAGKPYLIYSVKDFELKFIAESKGTNGDIATLNAVKTGTAPAGEHLVALPKSAVDKRVQVDPEEREPVFKISRPSAKRKYTRRAKPAAETNGSNGNGSAPAAKTTRKKPGPKPDTKRTAARKKPGPKPGTKRTTARKKAASKPTPAITAANPFA